ncbi:MAG: 5-formyltetrahydrofolate cyclo-ligase [Acutalibacteraceae bacterium]
MMNKTELRAYYKSVRQSLTNYEKQRINENIFTRLINSDVYKNASGILCYVSVADEIDTLKIIDYSLNCGKTVGIPFCENNNMHFYRLDSLDDLVDGKYGIPTVETTHACEIADSSPFICLVPGLCFDLYGNRIGYGGGYYDRFLSENKLISVGLCCERCLCTNIQAETFDKKTDFILTENKLITSRNREASTYE